MMQGTTPTHEFILPFDAATVREVRVTYKQNGATVLEKTETDCTKDGNSIKVVLTQEETFKFDPKYNVEIQLRVLTADGVAMTSQPEKVRCSEAFNTEVLAL